MEVMAAVSSRTRGAVCLLVVGLAVSGCGGGSSNKPVVAKVARGEVRELVEAPATVAAKASASVTSPADGRVGKLLVHDGQAVKQGQTLMVVSSPSTQQRLKQAKNADAKAAASIKPAPTTDLTGLLAGSNAAADAAFSSAQQAINLIPDGPTKASAQARLNTDEANYNASKAQAQQAIQSLDNGLGGIQQALSTVAQAQRTQTQAAVSLAQQAVSALTIKAPVAGTLQLGGPSASSSDTSGLSAQISQLPSSVQGQAAQLLGGSGGGTTASTTISLGTPVSSGTTLATITDASTLSLDADVDETDVLLVRKANAATVDLDAVPDATYSAVVQTIGQTPTTSAEGGVTYRVRLSLGEGKNADGSRAPTPKPGMSAVVDLLVRDARNVLAVPAAAVIHDGTRDFVWADVDRRAHKTYVTLGAQGDSTLQVLTGLTDGQLIVTQNAEELTEGQKLPA
jgi:multidrug efflux pump subunit AcrA (membrane-fusion protein)